MLYSVVLHHIAMFSTITTYRTNNGGVRLWVYFTNGTWAVHAEDDDGILANKTFDMVISYI